MVQVCENQMVMSPGCMQDIPLHGVEVVLNSVPCGSGIFMNRMQPSVSLPTHLFLILISRFEAFNSITVCIGCVAT